MTAGAALLMRMPLSAQTATPPFAAPFSLFSAGDPALEDIRFLARETGHSPASFTPPLTRDEVVLFLNEIDENALSKSALSPSGAAAYARIREALHPKPRFKNGFFSIDAHISAAAAARVRTDAALEWQDFLYQFKDEPSFLSVPLNIYFGDAVQLFFEPFVARDVSFFNREAGVNGANAVFGTNIPYKAEHIDLNLPLRAFFAAGGAWWNFEIGRDRVSFGTGRTGNLAVSDTPDFYDMARLSVFSSVFKYSSFVAQAPLTLSNPYNSLLADGGAAEAAKNVLAETTQRYLYVHRLDVRLFQRLSLALTEGVMAGNAPLELRFLNPLTVFHSFFSWLDYDVWDESAARSDMTGSLFAADIDWAAAPGLALYGQFVMNEYSSQYELDNYPESQAPNALGWLAGVEFALDFNGWQTVFWGEFVYTDPFLYTLSSPFASFIWMRRLSDMGPKPLYYTWFGHPEGRDTVLFALGSTFSRGTLAFSADISLAFKGGHSILWDWGMGAGYNDQQTPSGAAEKRLAALFGAQWRALPYLTFAGNAGGAAVFAADDISGAPLFGAFFAFAVKFFL